MRRSLLEMLRCPDGCAGRLEQSGGWQGDRLLDGTLCCPGCGRSFAVERGIPRMLPTGLACEQAAPEVAGDDVRKRSEMRARDDQAEAYDRMWYLNLFGLVEIPATLAMMSLAPHHTLLEAGCGTGRMTREFAGRCERLICVDYSWESLQRCSAKVEAGGLVNVDLVQADITHVPLKGGAFDRVVSCQVLEHVPSRESRAAAVRELARVARAGGRVTISAYQYNVVSRLFGRKEGEHDGGIYFYRFGRRELCDLLGKSLIVDHVTGALMYHYIAACTKGA